MPISIRGSIIFKYLLIAITALLICNIAVQIFIGYSDFSENVSVLKKAFDFNYEHNIPTFFASLLFLFNGFLLVVISSIADSKSKKYWFIMALVFGFLAMDEMLIIHEHLDVPFRKLLSSSGVFYFAWIIPYSIIILFLAIYFYKFLRKLPLSTQKMFMISLVIFLLGAIGIELLEGNQIEKEGMYNLTYFVFYTIEETLEMIGLSIFSYALLNYILGKYETIQFTFSGTQIGKSKT